jgi:hypothetical protein
MSEISLPAHIPRELAKYFWDVKPETVNPATHPYFVINRLLDKGGIDAASWVVRTFPKDMIIKSLMSDESLSPMTATFFARYYEQPYSDFACYKNRLSFKRTPSGLWNYA